MIPVLCIQGPTGVGKSSLAIRLAQALNTQIISADSRQVYKHMDIGTAKVSKADQALVPHHLIDVITPDIAYDVGQFTTCATEIAKQMWKNGQMPIICGGTGFYIKSLLEGIFSIPDIPLAIRNELREKAFAEPHLLPSELARVDPESAKRIEANDPHRIIRALEVFYASGMTIGEHWRAQKFEPKFVAYNIFLNIDRQKLYTMINLRVEKMLEMGLLAEIEKLFAWGYKKTDPGLNAVGYKEFLPHLCDGVPMSICLEAAQQNSRRYAKRQLTWYRKIDFDLALDKECLNFSGIISEIAWFYKNHLK